MKYNEISGSREVIMSNTDMGTVQQHMVGVV